MKDSGEARTEDGRSKVLGDSVGSHEGYSGQGPGGPARGPTGDFRSCAPSEFFSFVRGERDSLMILPQVHLRKPCYDFYFL